MGPVAWKSGSAAKQPNVQNKILCWEPFLETKLTLPTKQSKTTKILEKYLPAVKLQNYLKHLISE